MRGPVIGYDEDGAISLAVAVAGPTGSGKSAAGLAIARAFNGEIVNCDSLQLYRHLNIGTAKVTEAERGEVVHHLLDVLEPDRIFTAGDYVRMTRPLLREIAHREHLPVVVGGTGFYLRAVIEGLFDGPGRDDDLRRRLVEKAPKLHRILARLDPAAAERIHWNDTQKLVRAVEVALVARRPISALQPDRERLRGFRFLKIGLAPPRPQLYARINRRCEQMFAKGLLDEVRHVLELGYTAEAKALEAIGYRQALAVLAGQMSETEALASTQQATRNYAKRQWTWFRKEAQMVWIEGFGDDPAVQQAVIQKVNEAAKKSE